MTRTSLALTSLVAAIPGGFMAYVSIMAFLSYTEKMPTMLTVVNGVTLLISVLLALAPIAILIFMKSQPKDVAADGAAAGATIGAGAATAAMGAEDIVNDANWGEPDEVDAVDMEDDLADDAFAGDDDEFASDDAVGAAIDDEEDDDFAQSAGDDAFEFDDDDFDLDDDDKR